MNPPRITAVIVNWNGTEDTRACVAQLRTQLGADDHVIVVDNGSTPEQLAEARSGEGFELIENGRNLGFAGATNVGVRRALELDSQWILWRNNDALPRPGCIGSLLSAAVALDLSSAQPLLVSEHAPDRIDSAGLYANRGLGASDWLRGRPTRDAPTQPTRILGPCGAAALFRAQSLREAGLMDDDLFVLCEDLDQSLRIAQAGGRSMLVPNAVASHRRGVSDRPEDPALRRRRKLWLQRNAVALGLRDWPAACLLLRAPLVGWRAAHALWLARGTEFGCGELWRRGWAARGAARRAMSEHGVDAWAFAPPRS